MKSKGLVVRKLFDDLAHRYDLANIAISLGFSEVWRRKALNFCNTNSERALILDLCSGTGAFSFTALDKSRDSLLVVGVDLSRKMTSIAVERAKRRGLSDRVLFIEGDALNLPLGSDLFDCVLTAFCLRNVESLEAFFEESYRVLRRGGVFVALDLSIPSSPLVRYIYEKYLKFFVSPVGSMIAGKPLHYYYYIAESLRDFPDKRQLAMLIAKAGFARVRYYELSLGAISVHVGEKLG
ncbi:MAG: ubiquinone/menaquinone biosynthesis methyltransferase [Acidilobaceae archaeon]